MLSQPAQYNITLFSWIQDADHIQVGMYGISATNGQEPGEIGVYDAQSSHHQSMLDHSNIP